MKTLSILVLSLQIWLLSAAMAPAQGDPYDAGVFGDPLGTATTLEVGAFSPFNAYVVAFELNGLVKGFEVRIVVPPTITVTGSVLAGPAPINLGDEPNEFIVGTGGCIEGTPRIVLLQLNCGLFVPDPVPTDLALVLQGTSPSSFGGPPGYVQCDNVLVSFTPASIHPVYPSGALIINPTQEDPIAVEASSFGAVKSRF